MNLPLSLSRLVQLITKTIDSQGNISPLKAKELVLQADVQLEDMMHYADFNHPIEDCYGRKLVYDGGSFEVMVMSWNPRDYSSIHNHGYTQWGVVQVFGDTHHLLYNLKDNYLDFAKKEFLRKGEAIKVNNALIHQMGNATSKPYMTLHVYGSNLIDKDITADAKNFDLEFNRIAHTCGGAFFNLSEDAIHSVEEGIQASPEVFIHYAHLLMDYYSRQEETMEILELKHNILNLLEKCLIDIPVLEAS